MFCASLTRGGFIYFGAGGHVPPDSLLAPLPDSKASWPFWRDLWGPKMLQNPNFPALTLLPRPLADGDGAFPPPKNLSHSRPFGPRFHGSHGLTHTLRIRILWILKCFNIHEFHWILKMPTEFYFQILQFNLDYKLQSPKHSRVTSQTQISVSGSESESATAHCSHSTVAPTKNRKWALTIFGTEF